MVKLREDIKHIILRVSQLARIAIIAMNNKE